MVTLKVIFCIIGILLLFPFASASLNITSATGYSHITWNWNAGTNLSEMKIDGKVMCGYESTIPSITVSNFSLLFTGTCHTLEITDDLLNTGNNTACTIVNATAPSYGGATSEGGVNMDNLMYIAIGGTIGGLIGIMFIAGRLRRRN